MQPLRKFLYCFNLYSLSVYLFCLCVLNKVICTILNKLLFRPSCACFFLGGGSFCSSQFLPFCCILLLPLQLTKYGVIYLISAHKSLDFLLVSNWCHMTWGFNWPIHYAWWIFQSLLFLWFNCEWQNLPQIYNYNSIHMIKILILLWLMKIQFYVCHVMKQALLLSTNQHSKAI